MATTHDEERTSAEFDERSDPAPNAGAGPSAALGRLEQQLAELVELARTYLELKKDSASAWLGKLLLWCVAGLLAVLVLASILIAAAVILVLGVGQLLGELLGDRLWAGYLITGAGLIAIAAGGLWIGARIWRRSRYQQTLQKYAARQQAQRERFGHDVSKRA